MLAAAARPSLARFEVALFSNEEGSPRSAGYAMMDVFKGPSTPAFGRSARAMIFQDALPHIKTFLKPMQKLGLPLFWERAVIEILPKRVLWWPSGDTTRDPQVTDIREAVA